MYAVASIEKFVTEHQELISDRGEDILLRAQKLSTMGAIPVHLIERVMGDVILTVEFMSIIVSNKDFSRLNFEELTGTNNLMPL